MFKETHFQEGAEQSATLEEIDGVVSNRSFEMLMQWICLGRIVFGDSSPTEAIDLSIEFARLADMCNITGVDSFTAEHVKGVILSDAPRHKRDPLEQDPDTNNYAITIHHIESAVQLPNGHPIRSVLASTMVESFLETEDYRFKEEMQHIPGFAVDMLAVIKAASKTITQGYIVLTLEEPQSGQSAS